MVLLFLKRLKSRECEQVKKKENPERERERGMERPRGRDQEGVFVACCCGEMGLGLYVTEKASRRKQRANWKKLINSFPPSVSFSLLSLLVFFSPPCHAHQWIIKLIYMNISLSFSLFSDKPQELCLMWALGEKKEKNKINEGRQEELWYDMMWACSSLQSWERPEALLSLTPFSKHNTTKKPNQTARSFLFFWHLFSLNFWFDLILGINVLCAKWLIVLLLFSLTGQVK